MWFHISVVVAVTDGDDYRFIILSMSYRTFKQSYKAVLKIVEIIAKVLGVWWEM